MNGKKIIGIKMTRKAYREAFNVQLSDKAALKIREALGNELSRIRNAPPKPIMTLPEVTDYLRMTPESIEDYLGDLPCFELGGKLLFRKEAVDEWIKNREKNYAGEVFGFDSNSRLKFEIA